jgi:hypothetical protein
VVGKEAACQRLILMMRKGMKAGSSAFKYPSNGIVCERVFPLYSIVVQTTMSCQNSISTRRIRLHTRSVEVNMSHAVLLVFVVSFQPYAAWRAWVARQVT